MKYYSEKLNKPFDTEKECLEAEREAEAKLANSSRRKKELSKAIEEADTKVAEANKLYDVAREEARRILEESNKQVEDILKAAQQQVKDAERAKLDAIMAFNKEFGKYTVTLTGEKAVDEFNKSMQRFNRSLENFLKAFWF